MSEAITQTIARPITLLICDDHRILTDALAMVIEHDPTISLAGPPVHDPRSAIDLAQVTRPDVVLMDIMFRGSEVNGIQATRRIKEISPASNVIVMTAHEGDHLMVEAVEAGACGFLEKSGAIDGFLTAVHSAADGEALIDEKTLARILQQVHRERRKRQKAVDLFASLTARELDILQSLAQGNRADEIADALDISPQTVQTHVRNLLKKLGVHSKLEAVAFAVKYDAVSV